MPLLFQSLASGSNGNCFFIGSSDGAVLVEAGISFRSLKSRLASINQSVDSIKAIFVTHGHTDHIKGLPVIIDKLKVPVIASEQTLNYLYNYEERIVNRSIIIDYAIPLQSGIIGEVGPFKYTNINVHHDFPGATAFKLQLFKEKINISLLTDTGSITTRGLRQLESSDLVLIESNHDKMMLKESRRPKWLKDRIREYHLSNDETSTILQNIKHSRVKAIVLGHFSGECNSPDLVSKWVRKWSKETNSDWDWYLSPRDQASDLLQVSKTEVKTKEKFAGKVEW